jgi:hypothetical protein
MSRFGVASSAVSLLVLAGVSPSWAAREVTASRLAAEAPSVAVGEEIRVAGLSDRRGLRSEIFRGTRFEVFTRDARVIVMGADGARELPPPRNVYLKGRFENVAGSRVLLTVLEGGAVRGVATDWQGAALILPAPGEGAGLEIRPIDAAKLPPRPFACDAGVLSAVRVPSLDPAALAAAAAGAPEAPAPAHTARVAVETDTEFFALFGNAQDATNYVGDVIAFMSILYEDEVETSISVPYLRLWSAGTDPWTQTSTICNLFQLGKVWNDTQAAVSRTIVHMMSGKNNGGGVAWVGVLCEPPFNYDTTGSGCTFSGVSNYGGGYGYTGTMDGDFLYEDPGVLWDIVAASHEIGHNFSSRHTHCYANVGGNPSVVDGCYAGECGGSGCHCGATGPPGVGTATGGTLGTGAGTVMGYCHLLSGGFSNVTYTFGEGHPFGVAASRVPAQMMSHVASAAGIDPACLAFVPGTSVVFRDGVDQGSTSNWSVTTP